MTVKELAERLSLTNFAPGVPLEAEVRGGYTCDLLSDVMGHAREGQVWITLQTHRNVTGVASLKDLAAIIIVKGFTPAEDTVSVALEEGIPLLGTTMQAFEISGLIYQLLKG